MKVFVAGATGVLGRPTLARLVAEGHDVRAVARSAAKSELVRSLGARPVQVDLFDPVAVRSAVEGVDAVMHLATHIPPIHRAVLPSAWATNDRLRREGTRILVDAALDAAVGRFVKESLAFVYEDGGDRWLDEDTPVVETRVQASVFDAEREVRRFGASGGAGVVVRLGMFYGPDATSTDEALRLARLRIGAPVMGGAGQFHPAVHTDDAASAVVAALHAPPGTYNAAGTPATKRQFLDAFSDAFGLPRLRLVPGRLVRATTAGMASFMLRSQRVSSRSLAEATGWEPAHPDIGDGWAAVAAARQGAHVG
jgi:2-alkyl-3-oxoalkanoate reductase